jgi:ribosome recycling factor
MALLFPDKRKAITGEFFINDSRIRHTSRKAFKKIKSWKASFHVSEDAEQHYQQQFDNLVRHSFFNMVSNRYVLAKEKFEQRPILN